MSSVRIYVLCHNEERLAEATEEFRPFVWAHPILMKYQDSTFENAFWRQLLELKEEWEHCDMVGILSAKAGRKLRLSKIDGIINTPSLWQESGYFHFFDSRLPLTRDHPHLRRIMDECCHTLRIRVPTENWCNYWMCSPAKMMAFIRWFEEEAKPTVLAHPLAMTDARYCQGTLTPDQLLAICGVPYYPHVPFVFERMNKSFFV